jgi:hypothetical protein
MFFHIYYFSFPFGFVYVAYFTFAAFVQHIMVYPLWMTKQVLTIQDTFWITTKFQPYNLERYQKTTHV